MPGGAAAIRQPWRMAAAYLDAAYPSGPGSPLAVERRNEAQWASVVTMARRGINAPLTSSAGRLFDAVAALLGVRDAVNYEGQAAIELEQLADQAETGGYRAAVEPGEVLRVGRHRPGPRRGRRPGGRCRQRKDRGQISSRDRGADCRLLRTAAGADWPGHGRAIRRGVPESAVAAHRRRVARVERLHGAHALAHPVQRRRDQPRPGRRGGRQDRRDQRADAVPRFKQRGRRSFAVLFPGLRS